MQLRRNIDVSQHRMRFHVMEAVQRVIIYFNFILKFSHLVHIFCSFRFDSGLHGDSPIVHSVSAERDSTSTLSAGNGPNFEYLYALKGPFHQIRSAWIWCGSLGLGKDIWRWTFKIILLFLYFCIGCWSSYATHTKHLPVPLTRYLYPKK
jgi:hypothetical protein